jgi:hypothetical protein
MDLASYVKHLYELEVLVVTGPSDCARAVVHIAIVVSKYTN